MFLNCVTSRLLLPQNSVAITTDWLVYLVLIKFPHISITLSNDIPEGNSMKIFNIQNKKQTTEAKR